MEQKIERVPANLCATPFEKAIDEKIVEMNKKGFRFIPPMPIVEAEGTGEYANGLQLKLSEATRRVNFRCCYNQCHYSTKK
jgi:hypothetical protein